MVFDFSFLLVALAASGRRLGLDRLFFADKRHARHRQGADGRLRALILPVIVIVLVLRSFLYEPFRIPDSMMPTLIRATSSSSTSGVTDCACPC